METYATWARMFELQKYYSWIVDRFHISTQAYQKQAYGKEYDFRWLEERLLPLNFRIVFCVRSPESFEAARAERLKVSGNPSQYDDLSPFIREQELMRAIVANSMLPGLTLDISDNNIPAAVARVADWLEESGGLYMPD
jgi:thymidylate kinase